MKTLYLLFAFLIIFYSCTNNNPVSYKTDIDLSAYPAVRNSKAGDSTNKAVANRDTKSIKKETESDITTSLINYESEFGRSNLIKPCASK